MTQDGGRTWTEIESDIWDNIRGLYFASDQEGWAVGDRGLITHTVNGGRTWEHQKSGWWYTLTDVYFINPEKGWVIGDLGTVLHTSDGGESWVKQTPGGFQMLKGVFFFDDHIGWVIGWPGVCLHTENGGLTWTTQTTGTYNELYGVYFVTSNIGWIVAQYGEILHTTNGGQTWKFQYSGTDKDLNKVYFANRNYGMIIGDEGLILTTIDGGQKWEVQESGTNNDLYDFALSPEGMVAVGKGGITMRYTVEDEDLPVDLPPTAEEVETLVASGQLSMEVVAYEWEIVRHTNWQTDFADVFFVDSQLGWVVGSNGKISHTVNSGQTWMPQRSPEKTDLKTVFFTDKRSWLGSRSSNSSANRKWWLSLAGNKRCVEKYEINATHVFY